MHTRFTVIGLVASVCLVTLVMAYGNLRNTPLISFIADMDNQIDIFLADPGNGDLANLTQSRAPEWSFGWSQSGTLYYTASINLIDTSDELFIMTRPGKAEIITPKENLYSFGGALSPDGNTFAYFSSYPRNVSDIYSLSLYEGTIRNLSQTESRSEVNPLWSPDGRELLYRLDGDLMLLDIGTGEHRMLADMNAPNLEDAVWSPDGAWVVFYLRGFQNNQNRLQAYIVSSDGSLLYPLNIDDIINSPVTWSPDSQQLVFAGNNTDLIFYDVARDTVTQRVTGENRRFAPAWSPDGTMIAFIENRNLHIYDLQTGNTYPLVTTGRVKPPVIWQP